MVSVAQAQQPPQQADAQAWEGEIVFQKIKCWLFGHRYLIWRVDMVTYSVYDVSFRCACDAMRTAIVRTNVVDEADFWFGQSLRLQPPRIFP